MITFLLCELMLGKACYSRLPQCPIHHLSSRQKSPRVPCTHLWLPVSFCLQEFTAKGVNTPRGLSPSVRGRSWWSEHFHLLTLWWKIKNCVLHSPSGGPQWVGFQLPIAGTWWLYTSLWPPSFPPHHFPTLHHFFLGITSHVNSL